MTKLCGKLLNQIVLLQDRKRAKDSFWSLRKEDKADFKSKETAERMRSDIRIYGYPVYMCPKSTGTSGWSTFEIVFEQPRIA